MYQARTTAHLKAHFPPPLTPLILLRGDDGWMFQTMWICNWVCLCNLDNFVYVVFLCSSHFSHAEYQLTPTYSKQMQCFCSGLALAAVAVLPPIPRSVGSTCIQLHSERQKWVWFSALENSVDCPLLSSCAYCTVKYSSSSVTLLVCTLLGQKETDNKSQWQIAVCQKKNISCIFPNVCLTWFMMKKKTSLHTCDCLILEQNGHHFLMSQIIPVSLPLQIWFSLTFPAINVKTAF